MGQRLDQGTVPGMRTSAPTDWRSFKKQSHRSQDVAAVVHGPDRVALSLVVITLPTDHKGRKGAYSLEHKRDIQINQTQV